MTCVPTTVDNPNRKESQESWQYKKVYPTMWNRQPNTALRKRSGQTIQTMQSEHK